MTGTAATAERTEDQRIGQWVTRHDAGRALMTKPHLVESIVAEEPVTRCGRRLAKREHSTFEYEAMPHLLRCQRCEP